MSIKLSGILTTKRITNARNPFVVGDLVTDIGNFKVKDNIVEQFADGRYEGDFVIAQIFPSSYVWNGRVTVELRATVTQILLREAEETPALPESPSEPDPIQLDPPAAVASDVAVPVPVVPREHNVLDDVPVEAVNGDEPDEIAQLFGVTPEIEALVRAKADVIKLDPTMDDRAKFRAQTNWIKANGYKFFAKRQVYFVEEKYDSLAAAASA